MISLLLSAVKEVCDEDRTHGYHTSNIDNIQLVKKGRAETEKHYTLKSKQHQSLLRGGGLGLRESSLEYLCRVVGGLDERLRTLGGVDESLTLLALGGVDESRCLLILGGVEESLRRRTGEGERESRERDRRRRAGDRERESRRVRRGGEGLWGRTGREAATDSGETSRTRRGGARAASRSAAIRLKKRQQRGCKEMLKGKRKHSE